MKYRISRSRQMRFYEPQVKKLDSLRKGTQSEYIRELIDQDTEVIKDYIAESPLQ